MATLQEEACKERRTGTGASKASGQSNNDVSNRMDKFSRVDNSAGWLHNCHVVLAISHVVLAKDGLGITALN